jgi:hypothetical protein
VQRPTVKHPLQFLRSKVTRVLNNAASGLIALDVDGDDGACSLRELEAANDQLPHTLIVRTGRGRHLLFQLPPDQGPLPCSAGKLGKGIDVRADGGYVVAPPSVHSSGARYKFEPGSSLNEIAVAPEWLLKLLVDDGAPAQEEAEEQVSIDDLRISTDLKRLIKQGKPRGQRSEAIFAVIRALVSAGYDDAIILSVLLDPANGLSEKPRQKGQAWLEGELRRGRDKSSSASAGTGTGPRASSGPTLVRLSDVESEEVQWLFYPYIPLGKLTLIEGDPGLGKSRLTHAFGAAVSKGKGLLNGPCRQPSQVLLLTMEDGLGDTVRPHLERLGADLKLIHAYNAPLTLDRKGLTVLEGHIAEQLPGLVIIDPLQGAMGGKIDLHRANETRPFMAALAELASKYSCAIVCVRHLTKGARDQAIYRGIGSIDITGAARSVLQIGIHPVDSGWRVMAHAKSNLGPLGPSRAFRISDDGTFKWGDEVSYTAEDLCRPSKSQMALAKAVDFLRKALAKGPVASTTIERDAEAAGVAKRTLWRAKKKLNVRARKTPHGWTWELPQ